MDKIDYLREAELFEGMPEAKIKAVSASFDMINFPKGKVIYSPDDPGEVLFLLKRGRVRVFSVAHDGRELTLDEMAKGAIFGEMALYGQSMYGNFAVASEDSLVCVVPRNSARRMLENNPTVALRLAEILGKRLVSAQSRLEGLALKDVRRRLASLLLELAPKPADGTTLERKYTHEELAKMVGASRESVSLALSDFRKRQWLAIADHFITLTDNQALKEYADL